MASDKELADFLSQTERRAYKQALYAVKDNDHALDIVQETMIKLAEKYGDKPKEELNPLFQRILRTTILDHYRKQKTYRAHFSPLSAELTNNDNELISDEGINVLLIDHQITGEALLSHNQTIQLIEKEIEALPLRQREAFLMRYWEEMSVAETAFAMQCSEGSVKTHCSRATHSLSKALRAKGIDYEKNNTN